jgi:hypothetical protein
LGKPSNLGRCALGRYKPGDACCRTLSQRLPAQNSSLGGSGIGIISVEADVHLVKSDLLVGHSSRSLERKNTLSAMYLEPLRRLIDLCNVYNTSVSVRGVFEKVSQQSLVLLIDLKDRSQKTLEEFGKQLGALRSLAYLTYWNGTSRVMRTLTIVASGKVKFDDILALDPGHRDFFFDARLRPSTISSRTIGLQVHPPTDTTS